MNDMSSPTIGPAVETDVLATIRRLLAQDVGQQTPPSRSAPQRRRLNHPRRHDTLPEGAQAVDDPLFQTEPAPPLRLVDHQRIRNRMEDRDTLDAPLAEVEVIAERAAYPFTLPAFDRPFALGYRAEREESGPSVVSVTPPMAAPEAPGPALSSPWQPRDLPASVPEDMAWLRTLPALAARLTEGDPIPSAPDNEPIAARAPHTPESEGRVSAAPEEWALPNPDQIRELVREALQQELTGEAGAGLGNAIQSLTRRAVADALADIARNMAPPDLLEVGRGDHR